MSENNNPETPNDGGTNDRQPEPRYELRHSAAGNRLFYAFLFALIAVLIFVSLHGTGGGDRKLAWGEFLQHLEQGDIESVTVEGTTFHGKMTVPDAKGPKEKKSVVFATEAPVPALVDQTLDQRLAKKLGKNYKAVKPPDYTKMMMLFSMLLTIGFVIAVFYMFRRTREQITGGGGGGIGGFGRSPARRYDNVQKPTTFQDVAGIDGVKNEVAEIVDYLKEPEKYQRMGARVPKGTLLLGPPGTGKTLLARAIAGEAGVPFFSINGSEFIQMYAGVGASRVRDLFNTAKENAPAILFIDEIDAVGRHRGTGIGAGHDEREQTLNQILGEMDGFTPSEFVMVIAATNRPDILDPALLRPGRFDRHITVDRPTVKGREAIFRVHIQGIPLADDVDLKVLARRTVGFTGADIRNLVNEATLWATRNGKTEVDMADFGYAQDKVVMGAKREEIITPEERKKIAYHEAGHTVVGWFQPLSSPVHKVTIVPRGRSLGATYTLPEGDQIGLSAEQARAQLAFAMGGRAAEKLVFNELPAGVENDLKQATKLARRMVTAWGMSDRLGPVSLGTDEVHPFLGREMSSPREFSEATARIVDEEVAALLFEADALALQLLAENRDRLDALAAALEAEEEIDEARLVEILGPSPYKKEPPEAGTI